MTTRNRLKKLRVSYSKYCLSLNKEAIYLVAVYKNDFDDFQEFKPLNKKLIKWLMNNDEQIYKKSFEDPRTPRMNLVRKSALDKLLIGILK